MVIAEGTADQLKDQVGGEILEFRVADRARLGDAVGEVFACGIGAPQADNETGVVRLPVGGQGAAMLVDPAINIMTTGPDPKSVYAYESADPVEALSFPV